MARLSKIHGANTQRPFSPSRHAKSVNAQVLDTTAGSSQESPACSPGQVDCDDVSVHSDGSEEDSDEDASPEDVYEDFQSLEASRKETLLDRLLRRGPMYEPCMNSPSMTSRRSSVASDASAALSYSEQNVGSSNIRQDMDSDSPAMSEDEGSDLLDFIVDDSASEAELRRGASRPWRTPATETRRRIMRRRPARRVLIFEDDSDEEVRVSQAGAPSSATAPYERRMTLSDGGQSDKENEPPVRRGGKFQSPVTQRRKSDPAVNVECEEESSIVRVADRLHDALVLSPSRSRSPLSDSGGRRTSQVTPSYRRRLTRISQSPLRRSIKPSWESNSDDEEKSAVEIPAEQPSSPTSPSQEPVLASTSDDVAGLLEILTLDGELSDSEAEDPDKVTPADKKPKKIPGKIRPPDMATQTPTKKALASPKGSPRSKKKRTFLTHGRQELAEEYLDVLNYFVQIPIESSKSADGGEEKESSISAQEALRHARGIRIEWNKRLTKCAGMARYKFKQNQATYYFDATTPRSKATQHANVIRSCRIQLSPKILVTKEQVYNTLAHEFCHVMTALTYGHARPKYGGPATHGKEFYMTAKRILSTVAGNPEPGVKVAITTCHTYNLNYKYVYQCQVCGKSFGRHSKGISIRARHRDPGCHGSFVQIKPVPRAETAWNTFRKTKYKEIESELMVQAGGKKPHMKAVMAALSVKWKEEKERMAAAAAADLTNATDKSADVVEIHEIDMTEGYDEDTDTEAQEVSFTESVTAEKAEQ